MTQEQQLYIAAQLMRLMWGNTTYPYMTQDMKSLAEGMEEWAKSQGWSEEETAATLDTRAFHSYYIAMMLLRYICVFVWLAKQNYAKEDFLAIKDILEGLLEKEAENSNVWFLLYSIVMQKCPELTKICRFDESSADQIMTFYEKNIEVIICYIPSPEIRQFFVGRLHGLLRMLDDLPSSRVNSSNGCMGWGIAAVVIGFIIWLI